MNRTADRECPVIESHIKSWTRVVGCPSHYLLWYVSLVVAIWYGTIMAVFVIATHIVEPFEFESSIAFN